MRLNEMASGAIAALLFITWAVFGSVTGGNQLNAAGETGCWVDPAQERCIALNPNVQ